MYQSCWTHLPICNRVRTYPHPSDTIEQNKNDHVMQIRPIPNVEKVIIWTHRDEWGRTSNTGSVLKVTIPKWCDIWMKGLEEHKM
mmetsp:Transcript_5294/g.5814  ORF Transcript_5294/g.5814 Transcript_5294/m.5814 type:complete len:85 (+) Transcript_5294:215-469(+)